MKKHLFFKLKISVCLLLWVFNYASAEEPLKKFFIGTYTDSGGEGIYKSELNTLTGKLSDPVLAARSANPSFLALASDGNYLLAVNETIDSDGNRSGFIESFRISSGQNQLARISKILSGGAHPCYVSVNKDNFVLAANYTGGNAALFNMDYDGRLKLADVQQHYGKGKDRERQEAPHVHSAFFESGTNRIFVADLGTDEVSIYSLDKINSKLIPDSNPVIKVTPGSGPRHLAFHPNGRFLYIACELSSSVSVVSLDKNKSYASIQSISAIPQDYKKPNTCADIHISKDGRFLYVSNRGLDAIAIFSIDPIEGKLKLIGHESTRGKTPRNFTLSPDEDYLLVANQTSQNIVAFKRNKESGKLTYTDEIKSFKPVCLLFQ